MFSGKFLAVLTLALMVPEQALGRERWLERDGKAVLLHPRRFGQENPPAIQQISNACTGGVCATLAGAAISTLLAASPACAQQDHADKIIDAAQQFDATTKAAMIAAAVEFRKAEKNTPPDFSTNPPTPRNSVFCDKAPKNKELNGLVQAQDPANGDVFFDPATKKSVLRGQQPNTFPFGTNGAAAAPAAPAANTADAATSTDSTATACAPDVTVTVTAAAAAATDAAPAANNAAAGGIGNFGSCTVPQIEFGVGFDNRKETSFRPKDLQSFNHGSAQAIGIITQFICDTLTNKCKADQTAKDTCKRAQAAAAAAPPKTGADADAFNAVFGINTNFKNVQAIDDQGRAVGAATAGNVAIALPATNVAAAAGGIGNFGSCTVPQIEFGVGFDNRKETSFRPKDLQSFNHGSAQAIGIIAQFICDTLTNKCKADQTAKDTCKRAQAAAAAAPPKTGADADAFNAVFGINTNFKNVQAIDDQGRAVGGAGAAAAAPAANTVPAPATGNAAPAAAPATGNNAAAGVGNFGKCSVPQIEFGAGFDNRKETSFRPVDRASFPHDSAQNGGIITQFICDTLTNSCGADQAAKATCQKARAAFDAATPAKSGAQADAFNAVFGKNTNFKSVAVIDNQGKVVA